MYVKKIQKPKIIQNPTNPGIFTDPPTLERGRTLSRISVAKGANFRGRKSNSLMNLCGKASIFDFMMKKKKLRNKFLFFK